MKSRKTDPVSITLNPRGLTKIGTITKQRMVSPGLIDFRLELSEGVPKGWVVLDEDGVRCQRSADDTWIYSKNYRIYSITEFLLFLFAIFSAVGAIFEILNFFS